MRSEVTDRWYRVFTYQQVNRVPDVEFWWWPQTIRRWLKEGLPEEFESERNNGFSMKLWRFFGLDDDETGVSIDLRWGMNPAFTDEILERKGSSVIMRDGTGVVAERFQSDADENSIPHFLRFPVETPQDWETLKNERYRLDDPWREPAREDIEKIRAGIKQGKVAGTSWFCGFYGQLRNWMGTENLSMAFYEYPEMVHDMVEHWAELLTRQIERLPEDILIDVVGWWEDMAYNHGPLVGPKTFREFLQPGYHRVMQAAKRRGCAISSVDCDGDPHDIVGNWLEEGVNVIYPMEVTGAVDPYAWRREFGKEVRFAGGIAKEPLVIGGKAIDKELERIKPLLEQGGYIPHLDHHVPPNVSYKNYCYYLEKKRKLIGKE